MEDQRYDRIKTLLLDLEKKGIVPFIGYGNPNADILNSRERMYA